MSPYWAWASVAGVVLVIAGLAVLCLLAERENGRLRDELADVHDELGRLTELERVRTHAPARICRTIPPSNRPHARGPGRDTAASHR